MRCDEALDAVQEALDGAGTAMEVAARLPRPVQDHLEACRDCRDAVHELVAIDRLLAETPSLPPMPVEMPQQIMAAIRGVPRLQAIPDEPPPTPLNWLAWALAFTLVVAGLSLFDPSTLVPSLDTWVDGGLAGLQALLAPFAPLCQISIPPEESGSLFSAALVMAAMLFGNWKLGRLQRS
ncbi:MAG: anti-sigma factor family protein [Candidatus Xenobia bacterium]